MTMTHACTNVSQASTGFHEEWNIDTRWLLQPRERRQYSHGHECDCCYFERCDGEALYEPKQEGNGKDERRNYSDGSSNLISGEAKGSCRFVCTRIQYMFPLPGKPIGFVLVIDVVCRNLRPFNIFMIH